MQKNDNKFQMPDDLKECVNFHGHLCPGLVYGYIVAKESIKLLNIKRSDDEEIVAVCENDSCAIDGLQVMLGTTAGKGNLIINDYGKNAYTVINRSDKKAYRFSRKTTYIYEGIYKNEFARLEKAFSAGTATEQEKSRQRLLKVMDLLSKPFDEVFSVTTAGFSMPPYAPMAPSVACAVCGEMTMQTKMVPKKGEPDMLICLPCSETAL